MSSFQIFALVGLASIAGVLISTSIALFRTGTRALAYWLIGWSALLAAGFTTILIDVHPEIEALRPLFSTFVAPFMLLGACAHTERTEPTWLMPGALIVSAARVSTFLLGHPDSSSTIAIATEPMLAFTAAWVMLNPRREVSTGVLPSDRVLAIGFLFYGAAEFFDASNRLLGGYGWLNWVAWIGVGIPLVTTQITVHLGRLGRMARRFQDEARTNEARLRKLAASMTELVAEFDDRGVLTFASTGAEAIGAPAGASLVGRSITEFAHPEVRSTIAQALRERGRITEEDVAAESGVAQPAILPDGSESWFEFTATSYRTPAGELRILVRLREVTESVRRETALRRREIRADSAERVAGIAAWQFEIGSRQLDGSATLNRLHGLEPTEGPVEVDRFRSRVHLEDRGTMRDSVLRLASEPGPIEYDYRIVRVDDGRIRTLRDVVDVDRDASGRPTRAVGITRDVTEEVEAMALLRRDQQRLRGLMESDIVGIFCAERSGEICEANDAFLAPLGYSKADLPLDWRTLTAPEFRESDRWRAEASDPARLPQPFEKEFLARDGRRVPMLLSIAQVAPDTALMIASDLSERRRAEAERARHERELEETVAVRTRE
ncbi:MAG: PAS domain S-box protein, partial [Myxococcota bacterium]